MTWRAIAAVAAGGAFGSALRYVVWVIALQRFGPAFPWGTLFINVAGSFAIGVVAEAAQTRALGISPGMRLLLGVGVLGGFTTFSTFAYDMVTLASDRALLLCVLYGAGSVLLGFGAAVAGIGLARLLL